MDRKIILIAHNLRSSHNIGSLFRTCEGLGVEKLILSGYTPHPRILNDERLPHITRRVEAQIEKTALGAQEFQSWEYKEDIKSLLEKLRSQGYMICALEQSPRSIELQEFNAQEKVAIILGNEVNGVEKEVLDEVDHILEIPMAGHKESFNVVQAAAMALYHLLYISG